VLDIGPLTGTGPAMDAMSTTVSGARAAVAGAVAALVALAAGELAAAVAGSEVSLVTAVGSAFIDRFATSLKDVAVAVFGANDKVALIGGIVVVSCGLAAVLGLCSRRWRPVAPVGIVVAGIAGAWALKSDPQGDATIAVVSCAIAVDPVAHRHPIRRPAGGPRDRRRRRVGAGSWHRAGRGPSRRWPVARSRTRRGRQRRDVEDLAAALERTGRRPPPAGPRNRRHRGNPDRRAATTRTRRRNRVAQPNRDRELTEHPQEPHHRSAS
jgi:hypothetical protein